ncbi:MAG: hypothetical protein FD136_1412 [Chitinophagaceae bacterium]|nr:MAG: hypothetical protein FD183_618 [Chitinophagaceae bacterium]TXT31947.1 MAG: hypothetical protein FD136_1412 [Chitinophagaceae bacterium]
MRTKTYDYIIVLKKKNNIRIDGISQLMLFLSVVAFIGTTITKPTYNLLPLFISLLILGWWIFCYLQTKRNVAPSYRLALLFAAIGWYLQKDGIWISFIYLIAAVLEKQVKFPEEIAFDDEEIVINSFPKKRYSWNEVSNIILKDGLLTVDFKNNQLIQKMVDAEVSIQTEKEFNAFVAEQVKNNQ